MDFCPSVQKDDCLDTLVFEKSIKSINCTNPFLENKNHICNDKDSAIKAKNIHKAYREGNKVLACPNSCTYVRASCNLDLEKEVGQPMIFVSFTDDIEVLTAHYTYTVLSLIAEIGGYVGLFLGWSVYQLTDLIDVSKDTLRRRFNVFTRSGSVFRLE